jgi:hypothetical protein
MIDRDRTKCRMFRSIRRTLWYLEDIKRQYNNPDYNSWIRYNERAKSEIKDIILNLNDFK